MNKLDKVVFGSGYAILGLLMAFGLGVTLVVVPAMVDSLIRTYPEFSEDRFTLSLLLTVPLVIGEALVAEVALLLRLVHKDRMFSERVHKWVSLLAWTSFALAISIASIGFWLAANDTLPPIVLLTIVGLTLLVAAVSIVTRSLLVLLRRATAAAVDLEGVI